MIFTNETPFPAELYRAAGEGERMYASLLVRAVYALPISGTLRLREAQPGDVRREADPRPHGALPADGLLHPRGTDVVVLGDAVAAPGGQREGEVRIDAGPYVARLKIVGDRRWVRGASGELRASAPEGWERIPLTWARAFGGAASGPVGPAPWPDNPEGRGYHLSEAQAEGAPLPNVEDPQAPLTTWQGRPTPVGCAPYPASWGLRVAPMIEVHVEGGRPEARLRSERALSSIAAPALSGQALGPGDEARLTGVHEAGPLRFRLPPAPAEAEISLGGGQWRRAPSPSLLVVDLHRGEVELSWRYRFDYGLRPGQRRRLRLLPAAGAP